MDNEVKEHLVSAAKYDAAETISCEQGAHWYDTDVDDLSQIPKACRPEGGYFEQALVFSEEELSSEEKEECWKLYQQTYRDAMVRGITALQRVPVDTEWDMDTEEAMIEAGYDAAKDEEC